MVDTEHLLKIWEPAGLLTWLVQVVPLFVFVSAAASTEGTARRLEHGDRQLHWWAGRALALARPTATYLAAIALVCADFALDRRTIAGRAEPVADDSPVVSGDVPDRPGAKRGGRPQVRTRGGVRAARFAVFVTTRAPACPARPASLVLGQGVVDSADAAGTRSAGSTHSRYGCCPSNEFMEARPVPRRVDGRGPDRAASPGWLRPWPAAIPRPWSASTWRAAATCCRRRWR